MAQQERNLINNRLKNLKPNERMFRANAGMGWTGSKIKRKENYLIIENPRPFWGLPEGFPDLFGWQTIEITPDMVGQKIAVFQAEEYKTGKLKLTKKQGLFGDLLKKMGGIFLTIREKN